MPTIPTQNIGMGGERFYSKSSHVLFSLAKVFFFPISVHSSSIIRCVSLLKVPSSRVQISLGLKKSQYRRLILLFAECKLGATLLESVKFQYTQESEQRIGH